MNTLRPAGVILHRKPGTTVSRSSMACAWGLAASTADLVSLILAMMTPRKPRFPRATWEPRDRKPGQSIPPAAAVDIGGRPVKEDESAADAATTAGRRIRVKRQDGQ
ncbi:hypothetical protein G6F57_011548 [Rhizopus arrhizus]|nr:hypothetical protein G6F57_011548 [Rhizopus arrhizus]